MRSPIDHRIARDNASEEEGGDKADSIRVFLSESHRFPARWRYNLAKKSNFRLARL